MSPTVGSEVLATPGLWAVWDACVVLPQVWRGPFWPASLEACLWLAGAVLLWSQLCLLESFKNFNFKR